MAEAADEIEKLRTDYRMRDLDYKTLRFAYRLEIDKLEAELETERKKHERGEWKTLWDRNDPDTSHEGLCSVCGMVSERPLGRYCKWCGAKMGEDEGDLILMAKYEADGSVTQDEIKDGKRIKRLGVIELPKEKEE